MQVITVFVLLFCSVYGRRLETLVHFDLKGAPPRPAYFMQLLDVVSDMGANGVVIEWEDMFPFSGKLESVRNGNAYSVQDVVDILEHASNRGLTIVPLIQTLGHLEWILKTEEYSHLREDPRYPLVACIGLDEARDLILEMVTQVLQVHAKFAMPFFHIGADEVFQIGVCDADKQRMAELFHNSTSAMEFDHIRTIALNITQEHPQTKVLMWFDELKEADPETIKEFSLDELVTPVAWKYTPDLDKDLPLEMWRNLSRSWTSIWGASAFKGADGPNKYWNRVKPYVQNNKQWFLQAVKYSELFTDFHAVILTGWQRYDHFASLCEMWPVSMASLAVSQKVLEKFAISEADAEEILKVLKCPEGMDINQLIAGTDSCRFPGYKARNAIRSFAQLRTFHENATWVHNRENGWLQASHMTLGASSAYIVDKIRKVYQNAITKLDQTIIPNLRSSLKELFFDDVTEEFLLDYVYPFQNDLKIRFNSVQRIDAKESFRPRPWFPLPQ